MYSGKTAEGLVDLAGLSANGIVPVTKTLVMDLLANGWPAVLDKAEGLAIVNDSTIAICNDNDYGQTSPLANGIATATTNVSHVFTYRLSGSNKLSNYVSYHCANSGLAVNAGPDKNVYVGYAPQACARLIAEAQGGTRPYQLKWNTGETNRIVNVCPTTTTNYSVKLTDAKGCIVTDTVLVCATDVRCGTNKVNVCRSVKTKVGNQQQTYCLAVPAVAVLINQNTPFAEWTLGACNATSTCVSQPSVSRTTTSETLSDDLSDEENALMNGDVYMRVYPNPATHLSIVTVVANNIASVKAKVTITDVLGKQIANETITVSNNSISKEFSFENNLPKGIYIVSVETEETVMTEKLIIQ
ncbi:MAG TPA: T9SS type A sorting domain-containing protein [Bacteroidia bacterium]|nr:T9SS type A sorting domain-containing protein [Bacteroidia bacterium]HRG53903.1 T9SS type A sorting domain-containing protein [Bacteroidia bacterium]